MITLRNLSLQRGNKLLFDHVNLTIHKGQKIGIIGANGTGKSSLFALLRGELHPDSGELALPAQITFAHVAQETPAVATPALDYVLEGDTTLQQIETALKAAQQAQEGLRTAELHAQLEAIDGYTAKARAGQLLHGLGFAVGTETQAVNTFSGGWRERLNLAQALMCRSDVLLLDEPTNHLDLDAVFWLEHWLKHYPGTLLLIAHDRDFLDNVVDHIIHVEQQGIQLYTGNYQAFETQRAAQLAGQQAAYQQQQREIAHIQSFVDKFRYKASKAKQAQSRLKALEKMEAIAPAHVDSPFHFQFPAPSKMPALLIHLDEISVGYQQPVLERVNVRITPGSRIGLLGPNGAGKSTLIKLLAGILSPSKGQYSLGEAVQIGYFAQHQLEQLRSEASPLQHLQHLDAQSSEQSLRNFLGGFGFGGDKALSPIAPFSGGEKARLALALLIWQQPHVLLLDEPTNHLDLEMRHALTLALQDYQGALVIVSHDRHLLRTTTDELLLVAQQRVNVFTGDLADYRQWLLEQRTRQSPLPEKKNQHYQQRKPLQNRLKQLEKDLDRLSAEKNTLESLLADPQIYTDKEKVQSYIHQQTQLAQQLERTEELWLEVTEALETLQAT